MEYQMLFQGKQLNKREAKVKEKRRQTNIVDLDTTRDLPVKRPLSAYVHFLNEGREQLQITHPHIGVIEQTTILGKKWRTLSKSQRQRYVAIAKRDQYRYEKEV